jgi:protein O-GlcNAc transferase
MGIFDRFRSTGQAVADSSASKVGTSEQDALRLIDEGHVLEAEGRIEEAMQRYLSAIRLAPSPARAHLNHGNILLLKGDLQGALDAFRTAIKHKPDYAGAYYNMGNALLGNGQLDEAVAAYRRALEIKPDYAEVHCSLGVALKNLGQLDSAIASFRRALETKADLVEAHTNLGNILEGLYNTGNLLLNAGKLEEAMVNFRQALKIEPNLAEAHFNLGNALKRLGRNEDAVASYRRALEIKPDYAEAHCNLGVALQDLWQFEDAVASYRRALKIKPDLTEAHSNLGSTLKEQGKLAEAEASYRRALEIEPGNAMFRVAQTFSLSIAPQTVADSIAVAPEFERSLRELSDWLMSSPANRARFFEAVGSQQPFYLAYRNGNHVALLSRYGDLVAASPAQIPVTSGPKRKKIRLVVVSNYFRRHSVWDVVLRGVLANMDRARFEVVLYNMSHVEDEETKFARSQCDVWRDFHTVSGFEGWLDAMAADRPDAIFYPEIGMDSMTCRLATRRLAPLQLAGWGHPITTGLPTIDLYFSGEMLEAPDADMHYRERLVRLPGTGCCTTPIDVKPEALPELAADLVKRRGVRFVIAQTPFKFDPADDALFASIAAAVGESTFILLNDPEFSWATEPLIARLNQAFRERNLDPKQHLLVIPWLSREKFYTLLDLCDIYLDCPSFSGYTTAWQAVHRGLPVVTLKGKFMRQRLAAGLLRKIGMIDTIAASTDDYVAIAASLAAECRDPISRDVRRRALKAAAPLADNNVSVVRAFEQHIIDALSERGRHFEFDLPGNTPPTFPTQAGSDMNPTTEPVWKMLDADLHLHTLDPNYAPVGLLEMVNPAPKRVLDLGCFCGGSGRWLKQRFPDCEVIGIEMLDKAAAIAAQAYDCVIAATFEQVDFEAEGLIAGSFDAIIAADVLEHIYNPWQALQRLKPLLAPGGAIYVSLPNVRNLNVLSALASGEWRYQGAGILDITHIRFFTLAQAGEMLSQTGWTIGETRMNPDTGLASLFEGKNLDEIKAINIGKLTLEGLKRIDVVELMGCNFSFVQ